MASISGAFGGLLAAAISNMQGVGGKPAWSWIFILEGLATVVAGVLSFWIIVDFPDTATFITEAERKYIIKKLQDDGQFSVAGETFAFRHILAAFRDYKTWLCMLIGAGYILTCIVGYYADRLGNRGYFNLGCFGVGIVGYIILITSHNATLSYIAIYLAASGIYPVVANSTTWFANNAEGSYKRGVTVAMAIGFANLQGIYRAQDAPRYILGHAVQLGYISLGFIATSVLMLTLHRENKKRQRGERDEIILSENRMLDPEKETRNKRNGVFETVEDARREKGDKWSGFRYHL
ncbi:hypothetical protein Clacol_002410 [Clathrus columnatus]|uniref:MFS general substrate transporter n=1 Tax=Clathrus columnatus TaxID=1419009 RepID=A0AAV5A443_9AGAM|nr:hypothetical protein Clacol_002410 [Clathrus columnatus]